ncbi:MAG: hypothetical protein ACOC44_15135 [Promethearchaeia archaeon]
MEINYNNRGRGELKESDKSSNVIQVRAIITCPSCDYNKVFRNQFTRKNIESMIVAIKCFDWLTCDCGELLNLELEFNI